MKNFEISIDKKVCVTDLTIKRISNFLTTNLTNELKTLINFFNQEYEWKGMFTIEDVKDRIQNNETLFILYYKENAIGYVFFKIIDDNTCFGYNLYVTKKIKKPKYSAYWFYNMVTNYMLCEHKKIKVEVENWNLTIIDIIKNIGYYERYDNY